MADCLFCSIVASPKPGFLVHDDADIAAFRDIHPQAPTHLLIVPKKHFADLTEMEKDTALIAKMFAVALKLAKDLKLDSGFRTVINTKSGGGQTVFHTHLHLLGGRKMGAGLTGG